MFQQLQLSSSEPDFHLFMLWNNYTIHKFFKMGQLTEIIAITNCNFFSIAKFYIL